MKIPTHFAGQDRDLINLFSTNLHEKEDCCILELSFRDEPKALAEMFDTKEAAKSKLAEIYAKIREHYGN